MLDIKSINYYIYTYYNIYIINLYYLIYHISYVCQFNSTIY